MVDITGAFVFCFPQEHRFLRWQVEFSLCSVLPTIAFYIRGAYSWTNEMRNSSVSNLLFASKFIYTEETMTDDICAIYICHIYVTFVLTCSFWKYISYYLHYLLLSSSFYLIN